MNSDFQTLQHLVLSFPDVDVETSGESVVDGLVLRCIVDLASGNRALTTIEEITRHIKAHTQLTFEAPEIRDAVERLERSGRVAFTDRGRHSISVEPRVVTELKAAATTKAGRTKTVRDSWNTDLRSRHPGLGASAVEALWEALKRFLAGLVNNRSAEAASFLYVDQDPERFEGAVRAALLRIEEILEGPELAAVAHEEFLRFILDADEDRTAFLIDLLNSAFLFHLLNIDSGASRLVRSSVEGKTLYLDTNVLFRLLALHGPRLAHAPGLMVEMSKELNCSIRVARATVEEFIATVRQRTDEVRRHWLSRDDFRQIAAGYQTSEIDFMLLFYREQQAGHVKDIGEFERRFLQIERMLGDWGIDIDEDWSWDEELVNSLDDRASRLYNWHQGDKSRHSCEHDVLIEHYIRQLRGNAEGAVNSIRSWFLTYDRRLMRFTLRQSAGGSAPFCFLASDWLQLVRQFLPRTADYDQAFLSLLATPLLLDAEGIPFKQVVQTLRRLERYEHLSPNVVAGMIADQEFLKRMQVTTTDEEERQFIESEAVRIAAEMETQVAFWEARHAAAEQDKEQMADQLRHLEETMEQVQKQLEETSEEKEKLAHTLGKAVAEQGEAKEQLASVTHERGGLAQEAASGRRTAMILGTLLLVTAVYLVGEVWGLASNKKQWAALVGIGVACEVLLHGWLWDRQRLLQAGTILGVLSLIMAAIAFF